jgi:O-antigen ligase
MTTLVRKPGTGYVLLFGGSLLVAIVMGAVIAYAHRFLGDNGPYIVAGACLVAVLLLAILLEWRLGALMLAASLPYQETINIGPLASGMKVLAFLTILSLGLGLMRERELSARFLRLCQQPLTLAVFALVLWVLTSVLWADYQEVALSRTITFAGVFSLMMVVGMLEKRYLLLLWAIIALSATLSVPAGYILPQDEEDYAATLGRVTSGLHPNDFAGLLIIAFFVAYFGLKRYRIAVYVLAPVLLYGIFASQSRTGLIALVATPVLAMLVPRSPISWQGRIFLMYGLGALVLAGIILAIPSVGEAVVERYTTLSQYQNEETWAGRWDIWWAALLIIAAHPLLGVGAGNYPYFALDYSVDYVRQLSAEEGQIAGVTHQIFLAVASELGLVGLALFVSILFFAFKLALELSQRSTFAAALFVGLLAYVLIGMTTAWEYQKIGYILFGSILSLGIQQGYVSYANSEDQDSP